ncbi:response regulator [Rhodothermus marinus]|uniref:response regulator n=1 Tax=Rhodothermus marinus TaxID=29549 RepID=UPI000223DDAD|nr:response regulator [Rhodothermus marinus]AEN74301.1 response regulator receiver protein [Rhodothermus marinus SG0.5JP17-172]BBM70728.1 response regulator [Rhodothermus marinus]BBM73713.1 response regulator [Rhodothermus marinus]
MNNPEPVVILLADDDPDDRLLTIRALKRSRLRNEIYTVEDGEELMDYLHRRGPYADPQRSPRPGLILLDLNMPRKDGREALQEIKSDPVLRRIPVVVLTTSNAEADILRSYDLGVNAFITKPVTFEELVHALQVLGDFWFEIVRLPSVDET